MSSGRIQLLLKGIEDRYVTGTPQITYFRSIFNSFNPFEIRHNENQFYSYGVAFGGSQLALIKNYGDIVRNNYLKLILPSLFVNTYGWCYPREAKTFNPDIFLIDDNFKVIVGYSVKDTVVYYNTSEKSWFPFKISYNDQTNKFNFNFSCAYIGFRTLDDAVFWGFKNYDIDISYTKFNNSYYVFKYRPDSEITLDNAGWVNSFYKYFRKYKKSIGSFFIDSAELYIGGQLIESLSGEYMSIAKDMQVPQQLQDSLNILEGAEPVASTSETKYYVYLPFSMKNIPLCALSRHPLEIKIQFKKFTDIIEPEYLNVEQFSKTKQLSFVSNVTMYDGQSVYYTNETRINDSIAPEEFVPKSAIRSYSNIYVLASKTSNILKYDTTNGTFDRFDYINAYSIKPSVGTYTSSRNSFVNVTKNGIVQVFEGGQITEFDTTLRGLKNVYYFSTLLFVFTDDLKLYILTEDFNIKDVYDAPEILNVHVASNVIYFIGKYKVYKYDNGFVELARTPDSNLTASTLFTPTTLCLFYKDSNTYYVSTTGSGTVVKTTKLNFAVTNASTYQIGNQSTLFLANKNSNKMIYGIEESLSEIQLSNSIIYGTISKTRGVWVSNNSTVYVSTLTRQPYTLNELFIPTGISPNVYISFDVNNTCYLVDDLNRVYSIDVNSNINRIRNDTLIPTNPKTLAYDGSFVYILPNNGTSNVIVYDVSQNFSKSTSYRTTRFVNPYTGKNFNFFTNTASFDGTYVYCIPDSRDSNIFVYNTNTKNYTVIDYSNVALTYDYTPRDLNNSIIVGNILYMFWPNGFYRYDTAGINKPYETYSSGLDTTGTIATIYDSVSSNVYIFDKNFHVNGFSAYSTVNQIIPLRIKLNPYDGGILQNHLYSSFVEYNSNLVFVPYTGNTFVYLSKINPTKWNPIYSPYSTTNGSNTSILVNNKTLFAFPGPSSSNTYAINMDELTISSIKTPVQNYESSTWDGSKYVYLTSPNVYTRFNTTLDVFNDYTGYVERSSNAYISPTDFIARDTGDDSIAYFVNKFGIIKYDINSNTFSVYSQFTRNEEIVGVDSRYVGYTLTKNGTLYISSESITNSVNIIERNDTLNLTPHDISYDPNQQYIFMAFSNVIGRLDILGDIRGTGYYNVLSRNRGVPGKATSSFVNNKYIYSTYESNTLTRYDTINTTYQVVPTKNAFSSHFIHFSNVYLFSSNGSTIAMYNFQNNFTSSNVIEMSFPVANITSAANTASYIYFASKTSNIYTQYDPIAKQSTTYTNALFKNVASVQYYNSNVFFFPSDSNVVVSYLTTTQNFTNQNDAFSDVKTVSSNVISVYNGTCLTDKFRVFKITEDDTSGSNNKFAGTLFQLKKGYTAYYTIGVIDTMLSPSIQYDPTLHRITTDLYFDSVGTWTFSVPYKLNDGVTTGTSFNVASIGAVYRNVTFNTDGSNFYYTKPDGTIGTSDIFYVPSTGIYSNIIPQISNRGYMATTDGSHLMNTDTYDVSGKNTIRDARYSLFANITIALDSTTYTFKGYGSNSISYEILQETIDDTLLQRLSNTYTVLNGGTVTTTASLVDSRTIRFDVTADRTTNFVPPIHVYVNGSSISVPSNITLTPNSPVDTTFNFSNIYSTDNFTYIFNENVNYKYGNLIAYKNNTKYNASQPIYSFPLKTYGIGNVDKMIQQGPIIYMITNNYSNIWRFNEQYDGTYYQNIRFSNVAQNNFSNADMFSLDDGIGVVSNSNIFGFNVQESYFQTFETNVTNPVKIGNYVFLFAKDGSVFYKCNFVNTTSNIRNVNLYTKVVINSPSAFQYAYYDNTKYLIVVCKGKILAYENPESIIATTQPTKTKNISYNVKSAGIISNYTSFIPSSNTNDVVVSYVNSQQRTYKVYTHPFPTFKSNTVQITSNVAYMLPTIGSNIVAFDMQTLRFSIAQVPATNPVYFIPSTSVALYKPNATSVNFDGRYISLSSSADITQYDTVTQTYLDPPQGLSGYDTAVNYYSNIYFMASDQVVAYSFAQRSYITTRLVPDECNGLQFLTDTLYMSSASNIYALSYDFQTLNVISSTPTGVNKPTKSMIYGTNVVFTYDNTFAAILDTTTNKVRSLDIPNSKNIIYSNGRLYASGDTFVSRINPLTGYTDTNSTELVFRPKFTNLGKGFSYKGNVFVTTDAFTFLIYNEYNPPFISSNMFVNQQVVTTHFQYPYIYYAPSNNTSNIIQQYDTRLPFFERASYSNLYTDTFDYRSKVIGLDDTVHFVPYTSSNLVTYTGVPTNYPMYPDTKATASYTKNSVYYANANSMNRLFVEPLPKPYDFFPRVFFSQPQNIKNITFDGRYIYTVGDFSYKIDTLNIYNYGGTITDTDDNLLSRNKYSSIYFDGRFINLINDSVTIYDTIPIVYPLIFSPSIITEYAYLSDDERTFLMNRNLQYIVKQIQKATITNIDNDGYYKIDFLNLLSEVLFKSDKKLEKIGMYLNGHEKFLCDSEYLSNVQLFNYHSRYPTRTSNVYMYSFANNPESEFPDGHINASRIIDKVFYIKASERNANVTVYGSTHNICKIKDGLGGLVFNNSSN